MNSHGLIFADSHMHTNPVKGLGIEGIAPKFKSVNGWFMAIVSLGPTHYDLDYSFEGYAKTYDILINECKKAVSYGLKVKCFAGVHPADIERMYIKLQRKPSEIYNLMLRLLNHIEKLINQGLIHGFGEFGRPHYTTKPEVVELCNLILEEVLGRAKDLDVVVHLHLEQGGWITIRSIDRMTSRVGIRKDRVLLHHADLRLAEEAQQYGYIFTLPGKEALLREAFKRLKPVYLIESDFIDDPKRPGVSSYPWDIVRNQLVLKNEGLVTDEYLMKLNIDMIERIYQVKPP